METFIFKTNINCSGCVEKVSPALNSLSGVVHWEVDTNNKDKVLTVQSEGSSEANIISKVKEAGFRIEKS